jgi:gamma-glutamylcysteine synthetase
MISYEMIHSRDEKKKTTNLIFLPPLGIRYFDIHALLPYAVEADQMLTYQVHMLWLAILEQKKANPDAVKLEVDERKLTIEDEM